MDKSKRKYPIFFKPLKKSVRSANEQAPKRLSRTGSEDHKQSQTSLGSQRLSQASLKSQRSSRASSDVGKQQLCRASSDVGKSQTSLSGIKNSIFFVYVQYICLFYCKHLFATLFASIFLNNADWTYFGQICIKFGADLMHILVGTLIYIEKDRKVERYR